MFEIDKQRFGKFIAELRKQNGLTQKELARRLFISDKAVSKWERGHSLPDITLLIPLANILEVTVTELLECERMERSDTMNTGQVDELVQKAISLSKQERKKATHFNRKRAALYGICVVAACAEAALLLALGYTSDQLMENIFTLEFLFAVVGCYFCLFIKERLPAYYDENQINTYSDGIFRLNLLGVSFNNSNWPHIVQAGRWWSMTGLVVLPLIYLTVSWFFPSAWDFFVRYVLILVTIGGLFIPMYAVAKKYE